MLQVDGWREYPYEFAYEEVQRGLWEADVDIPGLRLQLQAIFIRADSSDELEWRLGRYVYAFVERLRHPPRACWN